MWHNAWCTGESVLRRWFGGVAGCFKLARPISLTRTSHNLWECHGQFPRILSQLTRLYSHLLSSTHEASHSRDSAHTGFEWPQFCSTQIQAQIRVAVQDKVMLKVRARVRLIRTHLRNLNLRHCLQLEYWFWAGFGRRSRFRGSKTKKQTLWYTLPSGCRERVD